MLKIDNLKVSIKTNEKVILDNLNLEIKDGETHAIMGPNGTGKSSLAKTIMGHYLYKIDNGSIYFNDTLLNDLSVDARAKTGIYLAMQDPISVEGVKLSELIKTSFEEINGSHIDYFKFITEANKALSELNFDKEFIHRDANVGLSGGEKKKSEVLQIKVLKPKFIILDEIDSGLDVDSLKIVCDNINKYKSENKDVSILIITHYPRILDLLKPDYVHILNKGKIVKTGDIALAKYIEEKGYNENSSYI